MILGLDIGNTSTNAGLYHDEDILPYATFRYATEKFADENKLFASIKDFIEAETKKHDGSINGIVYSSVVPEINDAIDTLASSYFNVEAFRISHESNFTIKLMYNDPSKLGIDRIANAEAVHREYPGNRIIVDIGTATTFCVILADGTFDGGMIIPGLSTAIKSLAKSTSNLPEVVFEKPDRLVARDTINALKSGFFYAWNSIVEGIVTRIEQTYNEQFLLIFTGGLAKTAATAIERPITIDEMLTMKGMKYIYDSRL